MFPFETLPVLQNQKPVFVLASSQRTGSTLLQRMLNSCPRIMIWGEHLAHLSVFSREFQSLMEWEIRHADERTAFLLEGYDTFAPNIMPEVFELVEAARMYIVGLFGIPAIKLGRPVWGFKEVRYGAQMALFLQECFPQARFIHLTRNPLDCLISMRRLETVPGGWDPEWTVTAIQNWAGINDTFLKDKGKIHNLFQVKFEEMIAVPADFIQKLAGFLEIPERDFDEKVFIKRKSWVEVTDQKMSAQSSETPGLTDQDRALLTDDYFVQIAGQYGYQIDI